MTNVQIKKIAAVSAVVLALAACASKPEDIRTAYISTIQYESYDCEQIASETSNIERRIAELYQSLRSQAKGDAWQMGVGIILWPTLFALEGGDGPDAAEYSRLKGEYEALRQVNIMKKCSLTFQENIEDTVKEAT